MRLLQILVVEDEANVAAMYRLRLESDGFLVQLAKTGETALTLACRSRWNLVLLDMKLPGMSGLEVLAALRSDVRTAGLPVVVLSNRHDARLLDQSLALGAIDYLIKSRTTPAQVSQGVLRWATTQHARATKLPMRVAHTG
jgi:CheY-like chemotaxis protein